MRNLQAQAIVYALLAQISTDTWLTVTLAAIAIVFVVVDALPLSRKDNP